MRRRSGFTLVEMLLAIVIVGTGLTAFMNLMPVLGQSIDFSHEASSGLGLALLLINETDTVPFEDPASNCTFGLETDETASSRADFDDLDDYDGYTETPPADKMGNSMPNLADYTRSVEILNLDTTDLTTVRPDGTTEAKLVIVTVTCLGREVAQLSVVRFFGANRADRPLIEETLTPVP